MSTRFPLWPKLLIVIGTVSIGSFADSPKDRVSRDASQARDCLVSLSRQVRTGGPQERIQARAAIVEIWKAVLDDCLAEGSEASAQEDVRALLKDMKHAAALAEVRISLPDNLRKALIDCDKRFPGTLAAVGSKDAKTMAELLRQIEWRDETGVGEPLIVVCLSSDNPVLIKAAIDAVNTDIHKSDMLAESLGHFLVSRQEPEYRLSPGGLFSGSAQEQAILVLSRLKNPKSLPSLLSLFLHRLGEDPQADFLLAGALAAMPDVRAIPHLLPLLNDTKVYYGVRGPGESIISAAPCDAALALLVRVTRQMVASYSFTACPLGIVGFKSEEQRRSNVERFRKWWGEHRSDDAFKDIQPLVIPRIEPLESPPAGGRPN